MSEVFAVGDMVNYDGSPVRKTLQCTVVKVMPMEHSKSVQFYRVRDSAEAFERAVPECTLTRIEPTEAEEVFKS
jgi:hypothetical protein